MTKLAKITFEVVVPDADIDPWMRLLQAIKYLLYQRYANETRITVEKYGTTDQL